MYSTMTVTIPETMPETLPALTHAESVARLAATMAAIVALDRQIERCTDSLAEGCLLTLRVEHEVAYLETLYGWTCEACDAPVLQ
jgi:hypothetical protein